MTLLVSTADKTAIAALRAVQYGGGHIRVFDYGTRPTGPDQAEDQYGATLLGIITGTGLPVGFSGSGLQLVADGPYVVNDPAQPWLLTPLLAGTAGWFRFVANPLDSGGVDYSAYRFDGDIATDSTKELRLPSTSLVPGTVVGPLSFLFTIPPILG